MFGFFRRVRRAVQAAGYSTGNPPLLNADGCLFMDCVCDNEVHQAHRLHGKQYGGEWECLNCHRRKPAKVVNSTDGSGPADGYGWYRDTMRV